MGWSARGVSCRLGVLSGRLAGFITAVVLGSITVQVSAQPVLRAVPIADRVWFVQGESAIGSPQNRNFISNAAFFATRDSVVVIDALGSPALAEALIDEAERLTRLPVRYVIVTHYHADHVYGLQTFKSRGATIIAHTAAREYLNSETAAQRLQASRLELAPWVDGSTRLVEADRWVNGDAVLELGGERVELRHVGPAHTPEDLLILLPQRGVVFAGDLVFRGRVPFVGQADSRHWIQALDVLLEMRPVLLVPGHGPVSLEPLADLQLTRDYLAYLRSSMGEAARNLEPFDEAYARTDWSRFDRLPLFRLANRMNAYNTYLLLERESMR